MFGLSKVCKITTGSDRPSELQIQFCISRGAVAVSAMRGASHRARNPPMLLKQVRKSPPLYNNNYYMGMKRVARDEMEWSTCRPFIDAMGLIHCDHRNSLIKPFLSEEVTPWGVYCCLRGHEN